MPALCTDYDFKKLDGTYILPPILYPDGKYYLKLGHGDHFEIIIQNLEEMKNWYKNGNGVPEAVETLASFITESLIPTIKVLSVTGGCCVTSNVSYFLLVHIYIHSKLINIVSFLETYNSFSCTLLETFQFPSFST